MSNIKVLAERSDIVAIADAVRSKTDTTNEMTIGELIHGINNISTKPILQEKTITPSISSQNVTPDNGYDGLSKVTVDSIPSSYVKPTTTKGVTTYTPNTTNQTIAAGTYCSGAQTIKGDTNLIADNIKSGVSIFGVTGTHSGSEDLEAELTAQEAKIAELSALLDTKASGSGGGSLETCTVHLTFDSALYDVYFVSYTCVDDNGKLYTVLQNAPNDYIGTTQIITVPCGSLIFVNCMASFPDVKNVAGGLEVILSEFGTLFIQAPLTADSIGLITFYDADAW